MYSYESTAGIGGIKTARENTLREFDPSFGRTIDDLRKAGCTVTLRNSAWPYEKSSFGHGGERERNIERATGFEFGKRASVAAATR